MTEHLSAIQFRSDLLEIEEYRCDGHVAGRSAEECAGAHEIVFLRAGAFVRHDSAGAAVANANCILFFSEGRPCQISHPIPGGDHCTIFRLAPSHLFDLIRAFDPGVDDCPHRPFRCGQGLSDMTHRWQHYRLMRAVALAEDPLGVEEDALALLSSAVRAAATLANRPAPVRWQTSRDHADLALRASLVLSQRFREKLKLCDLARAVHSSPYHLCRVFRRQVGLSIHVYLRRLRLLGILEHLADHPNDELARLALDFGFASHSHFSTAFRRTFGFSPSEARASRTRRTLHEMRTILKV